MVAWDKKWDIKNMEAWGFNKHGSLWKHLSPKDKRQEFEKAKYEALESLTDEELDKLQNDRETAEKNKIEKIKTIIDKNVFESYMSKNYSKVKDPTTLKPGQVYYITTKNSEGIRIPARYECPKTGPCNICENYPNEVCELWKKTTLGSMFGESAEKKYEPYTLEQYKEYMDKGLIDNNGNHTRDGIDFDSGIEIYKGRIYVLGRRKGGKTKRKHCKSKRKQCKSKRKGKGNKRHKTRRHSKK